MHSHTCLSCNIATDQPTYKVPTKLGNLPVQAVAQQKEMGVIIRSSNSLPIFCLSVEKQCSLHVVRRSVPSPPVSIKRSLYLTLMRSQLTYCCELWRPDTIKDITQLERIQ